MAATRTNGPDAPVVRVAVQERDDRLHLSIRDDGVGGAEPARGSGLIGLRDRAEAWADRSSRKHYPHPPCRLWRRSCAVLPGTLMADSVAARVIAPVPCMSSLKIR